METGLLGLYLLAGSDLHYLLEQLHTQHLEGGVLCEYAAVEVYPVVLMLCQRRVAGDLHSRNRGGERSAASGREQDDVCTGCRQCGGRYQIVARGAEQVQTVLLDALAVGQYVNYQSAAGLLRAAEGLVLQGGDAALLVAGGRVLVYGLIVTLEVVLEIVDEINGVLEYLLVLAAVHEYRLSAEHLRHFGQNSRAALGDEQVGERSDRRVSGYAGQTVRAAALHAYDQLAAAYRLSAEAVRVLDELLYQLNGIGYLILGFLTYKELDAIFVVIADVRLEDVNVAVLAVS